LCLSVRRAVAEQAGGREFFNAPDVCGNKDCVLAGRKRNGDFDGGVFFVTLAAAETKAAFGNVIALDEFFVGCVGTNAGSESDARTNVTAAIWFAATGKSRKRCRCYRLSIRGSRLYGDGRG